MPSGLLKRGQTWYIRYSVPGGKRKWEAIGSSKRQAELVLAKRKLEIKEGRYFSTPKGLKWTYGQLLDRYLDYAKVTNKPSTYEHNTRIYSVPLRDAFGEILLKNLRPEKVTVYIEGKLASGLAPATVRHHLRLLKHALTMAVKWGLVAENPLRDVRLPVKVNNARLRYLTLEEINRLLAVCPLHLRRLVLTALHTGMRRSEMLRLRWEQIDLEQRLVLLLDTKNGDKRGIPLTERMFSLFREIQAEQEQAGLSSPWVFPNPLTGNPYRHDSNTAWYRALERAEIANFRFHDLRHTFGSYLAMSGVDIRTIQEILGHKTLAMTQRYTRLMQSHKLAAIRQLDAAYPFRITRQNPLQLPRKLQNLLKWRVLEKNHPEVLSQSP
jgi:integrase